jgi:hypothetical protein
MNEPHIPYTQQCPYESIKNHIRNILPLTPNEFEIVRYGDIWFLIDLIAIYNEVIICIKQILITRLVPFTEISICETIKHHVRNIQPLSYSELEFISNAEIPFLLVLIGVYNQVIIDNHESYIVTIYH